MVKPSKTSNHLDSRGQRSALGEKEPEGGGEEKKEGSEEWDLQDLTKLKSRQDGRKQL